jgi:hypothetical protein
MSIYGPEECVDSLPSTEAVQPTADTSWSGHKITNVADPTTDQDAATKHYVDRRTLARRDPTKTVQVADTSSGGHKITDLADPTAAQDAVTKHYVDLYYATRQYVERTVEHKIPGVIKDKALLLDGTTLPTADINWGGYKITGLAGPKAGHDATTKRYVDSRLRKHVITVWAEESGSLSTGQYEWSFENGAHGVAHSRCGYTMMYPGRVLAMGLSIVADEKKGPFRAVVHLVVNGKDKERFYVTNKGSGGPIQDGVSHFPDKLELKMGDVLNFKTATTSSPSSNGGIVSLLIELDL